MIVEMVLGNQGKVDTAPFAVQQALDWNLDTFWEYNKLAQILFEFMIK